MRFYHSLLKKNAHTKDDLVILGRVTCILHVQEKGYTKL